MFTSIATKSLYTYLWIHISTRICVMTQHYSAISILFTVLLINVWSHDFYFFLSFICFTIGSLSFYLLVIIILFFCIISFPIWLFSFLTFVIARYNQSTPITIQLIMISVKSLDILFLRNIIFKYMCVLYIVSDQCLWFPCNIRIPFTRLLD